jgi:nucleoside-diphosphate-sugar epimerase
MKKVIITGVTGFIGSALAKKLLSQGVKVFGVGQVGIDKTKLNALKQYENFIPFEADFEQYDKLHEIINDRDFDMFWHFAWNGTSASAPTYNDYNIQIQNIKATCDAAHSAVKLKCKKTSSSSSYQQCNVSISESDILFNPVTYGIVKKCSTELFMSIAYKHRISCANVVFPNIYGYGDKPDTAIVYFIKRMLSDEPIDLISGKYKDDWIYIDDLIDGIIYSAKVKKQYAEYYIGHRKITTFKEKLIAMKSILSSKSELRFGAYPENYYVDYDRFDLDALRCDTGWEAKTNFTDGILKATEWVKKLI